MVKSQSSAYKKPVLLAQVAEETILSPGHVFGNFVKEQLTVVAWIHF